MPPRKQPQEPIHYPASKRKAPPFRPQRPSQLPGIPTTESESSTRPSKVTNKPGSATTYSKASRKASLENQKDEGQSEASDSDEELAEDPLAMKPKTKKLPAAKAATKTKSPPRDNDAMSITSDEPHHLSPPRPAADVPPAPTQLTDPTQIPQPLLVRLLNEHFGEQNTKIDKHAIQVVQKYLEVFVREAIARTAIQKREAAEKGEADAADARWLELEDLEKVAPGMTLDF